MTRRPQDLEERPGLIFVSHQSHPYLPQSTDATPRPGTLWTQLLGYYLQIQITADLPRGKDACWEACRPRTLPRLSRRLDPGSWTNRSIGSTYPVGPPRVQTALTPKERSRVVRFGEDEPSHAGSCSPFVALRRDTTVCLSVDTRLS